MVPDIPRDNQQEAERLVMMCYSGLIRITWDQMVGFLTQSVPVITRSWRNRWGLSATLSSIQVLSMDEDFWRKPKNADCFGWVRTLSPKINFPPKASELSTLMGAHAQLILQPRSVHKHSGGLAIQGLAFKVTKRKHWTPWLSFPNGCIFPVFP